jgi:hypothetical protein
MRSDVTGHELARETEPLIEDVTSCTHGARCRRSCKQTHVTHGMTVHAEHHMVGEVFATRHPFGSYLHREFGCIAHIGQHGLHIGHGTGRNDHKQYRKDTKEFEKSFHEEEG